MKKKMNNIKQFILYLNFCFEGLNSPTFFSRYNLIQYSNPKSSVITVHDIIL